MMEACCDDFESLLLSAGITGGLSGYTLLTWAMFAQDFSFKTLQISSCKQHSGFFIVQHGPVA